MDPNKTISIFTETFEDMMFNPLYDDYCAQLEEFIKRGFQFQTFMNGSEKPISTIATIEHFRNFKEMYRPKS